MKQLNALWCIIIGTVISSVVPASERLPPPSQQGNLGSVAGNIFGLEMNLHQFMRTVCIISGIGLFMAAIVKYNKHRQNPIEVSLGAVFTNIIIGAFLIILAFIPLSI